MSEEAHRLDERFEEILGKLKPYLLRLPASQKSRLCKNWLERLNRAEDQRALRNDYLVELYKQLKSECLGGPFDKPPKAGKLIPISYIHRMPASSSCNELTETSLSLCEEKWSWPNARSKSLRRDDRMRRPSPATKHCFNSSTSVEENIPTSPTVHFHEYDNRFDDNLPITYQNRIDTLNAIVIELEAQNEKMKQKIAQCHKASNASEVPQLQTRIKLLTNEIATLKKKLTEVCEIKTLLENNHRKVISEYKAKMTEQFNKMKKQLVSARLEKKELQSKIATVELKLQELNQEKELSSKTSEKTWVQQVESLKQDYEQMLQEKEAELRKKDELMQRKEAEIGQKIAEIQMLNERLKELQQLVDIKTQKDMKLQSMLVSQYNTIKDELSQMRSNIETATQRQSDSHKQEIGTLKRNLQKLEQEYEKKISRVVKEKNKEIAGLQQQLQANEKYSDDSLLSRRRYGGIGDGGNPLAIIYKEFLDALQTTAKDKRYKYYEKLSFMEDSMSRLTKEF
ncbi:microtubule-associated tumor suppressor 1 homolog [Phymastichus coffea]|uniref:microtubule-associated tumor suppressor 1 homolog n=1 Tax=Phymastichus coffea TaxID=108790 RepID=UPI00273C1333|nr:microtubule-associated tumor suppressor 1 homolog [Phymastichus coffea]